MIIEESMGLLESEMITKILSVAGFMMLISSFSAFAQNTESFTQRYKDGMVYVPDKDTKPVVIYADMDGDKKNEIIIAMQMLPVNGRGYYRTFAYVYRASGKGNPKVLLKAIPLGETLGACVDDDHEKVIETVDLSNDGKKAVALWSTSGTHYHGLIIIGMRSGKIVTLFSGGSDNQITYEPSKNKHMISAGEIEWSERSSNIETWREEIWKWNGKEFTYIGNDK
jgi:hypothetical protein